jgi:hypothetical protein
MNGREARETGLWLKAKDAPGAVIVLGPSPNADRG